MKQGHNHYFVKGARIASLPYGSRVSEHPKSGPAQYWEQRAPLGAGYGAWHLMVYPIKAARGEG